MDERDGAVWKIEGDSSYVFDILPIVALALSIDRGGVHSQNISDDGDVVRSKIPNDIYIFLE